MLSDACFDFKMIVRNAVKELLRCVQHYGAPTLNGKPSPFDYPRSHIEPLEQACIACLGNDPDELDFEFAMVSKILVLANAVQRWHDTSPDADATYQTATQAALDAAIAALAKEAA
jgi:hypothetical protein